MFTNLTFAPSIHKSSSVFIYHMSTPSPQLDDLQRVILAMEQTLAVHGAS